MTWLETVTRQMPDFKVAKGNTKFVWVQEYGYEICIDDRPGIETGSKVTHGVKTPGGAYGTGYIEAVSNDLKYYGEEEFLDFSRRAYDVGKQIPAVHDVDHMRCKHAEVVSSNGFGDQTVVTLKDRNQILLALKEAGGVQIHLQGKHNPSSSLRYNFKEGTTLLQEGNGYTADVWWMLDVMNIHPNALFANLEKTVRALGVNTIEVYE